MTRKSIYDALDFNYVLLDCYKKLGITEMELAVLLEINHLLEQGNALVTVDSLAIRMSAKSQEIDETVSTLLTKGFVSYEVADKGMFTSLEKLKARLYKTFRKNIQLAETGMMSEERAASIARLTEFFEDKLGRQLTPLENQLLGEWLEMGFEEADVKNALMDSLQLNKRNFRSVEKILKTYRRDEDMEKEGGSAVGESWDKDIESTLAMAKKIWGDDE